MNLFEKVVIFLQAKMNRPVAFGWFHILCLVLTFTVIFVLYLNRKKYSEKQLKTVLLVYGIVALVLEVLKQIAWSFNYDMVTGVKYWDYQWYAAPFQLCTMPIYFSLIAACMKKSKLRDSILSFIAFFTILGSISTMIIPESCFTEDILINIHTMYLHCGSFVVSVYLLMMKEIKINLSNFIRAFIVFVCCTIFANLLNILFYNTKIIGSETFNMFFISPYFNSTLPVFSIIQPKIPYIIYFLIYIVVILIGGTIIYLISKLISKIFK